MSTSTEGSGDSGQQRFVSSCGAEPLGDGALVSICAADSVNSSLSRFTLRWQLDTEMLGAAKALIRGRPPPRHPVVVHVRLNNAVG